jgi:hypothetical protein
VSPSATLGDLVLVIRSKNAGPFQVAVDLIFDDAERYERVHAVLDPELVAQRYRIPAADVLGVYAWDVALSIKVAMRRQISAGAPGDTDCYGAQQHAPLLSIPIPAAASRAGASG